MEAIKDPDCLVMSEGEKRFSLSMNDGPGEILIRDTDGKNIHAYDDNQVEFAFSQNDEGGWGCGCEDNVSTRDLRAMADCIREVTTAGYSTSRKYSCQKDISFVTIFYDV